MLKNLTITVEEEVLQWAKHEAIERSLPVSKFVGTLLSEEMRRKGSYWKAFEEWKKMKPWPAAGPVDFKREEEHERKR